MNSPTTEPKDAASARIEAAVNNPHDATSRRARRYASASTGDDASDSATNR